VTGTWINAGAIVVGGIFGLAQKKPLSITNQTVFKTVLGAFTTFCGLRLTWISVNGSFLSVLKQMAIVLVALTLGKMAGRLLHLQKASNRVGQFARERMAAARPDSPNRFNDGFNVCALLFCAAPLGILGAIQDGLSGYYLPLVVKAVMDGLAAMSFVAMFGGGIVLSAVPVLVWQGSITLLCVRLLQPFLQAHGLIDSINATGGLLVFCVALIIFEIKKIEVTDYLPSLAFAPLLTWWLR
jgi:uncharacterized membrane protein YqgA involved in biofilm formation